MIKFVNETICRTIKHLNANYPMEQDVYIHIADGYDCIEGPDGTKGFGVYVPEIKSIYIADDVPEPETTLIETIAHEYKHFMQHCAGEPFDEDEAEEFALIVVRELRGETNDKGFGQ